MVDSNEVITVAEFAKRLAALCLNRGDGGLPKKRRDQHILFKSISQGLDSNSVYTEVQLKERLQAWLNTVGIEVRIDHVSLRRYLVDAGYIIRDPAGSEYAPVVKPHSELFDSDIDTLDPAEIVEHALTERSERKEKYLKNKADSDQ